MADFAGGGEIVARGAEGTGAATILNNNPTLQSLARTTARLDNLFKLKLIAATPKKAKEEPPVNIDLKGVTAGPWQNALVQTNQIDFDAGLKVWPNLDRTGQKFLASQLQTGEATSNNFNTAVVPQITDATKRAFDIGYNVKPEELKQTTDAKLNEIDNSIKEYALKNNITDPLQLNKMRRTAIMESDLPGFYFNAVQTPENLDLNRFGSRLLTGIADKTIELTKKGGGTMTVSKGQMLKQTTSGTPEIDPEMAETLIYSNDTDARMYQQGIQKQMPLVVNSLNDPKALGIYEQIKKDPSIIDKLPEQDKKYFEEKVLIPTREDVLNKMFGGKSKISITTEKAPTTNVNISSASGKNKGLRILESRIAPSHYLYDVNGNILKDKVSRRPVIYTGNDIQLGPNTTVNAEYNIPTSTPIWFTTAIPKEVTDALGMKRSANGSYVLNQSLAGKSMSAYENPIFLTKTPELITSKEGYKGYIPAGAPTTVNNPNNQKVESAAILNTGNLIDNLPQKVRDRFEKYRSKLASTRIIVSLKSPGMESALAEFSNPNTKVTSENIGASNPTLEFLKKNK
jgi:hypothetical protein